MALVRPSPIHRVLRWRIGNGIPNKKFQINLQSTQRACVGLALVRCAPMKCTQIHVLKV